MKIKHFTNEGDLFSFLDPADPIWDEWCFRGEHQADNLLCPSVWRDNSEINKLLDNFKFQHNKQEGDLNNFCHQFAEYKIPSAILIEFIARKKFEIYLLSGFYEHANLSGLKISDQDLWRLGTYPPKTWFSKEIHWGPGIVAHELKMYKNKEHFRFHSGIIFNNTLPQHYGIPTRLLDFTTNPRKALYFASECNRYGCRCTEEKSNCCIYAINVKELNKCKKAAPIMVKNNNERSVNNFLHAQDGLFIEIGCANLFFIENNRWPTLEDACKLFYENVELDNILVKVTYPASLNNKIYHRLRKCGISVSTLMPGYSSISKDVKQELMCSSLD